MDKKKQLQIQNSKFKLNKYEISLNELTDRRNILLAKAGSDFGNILLAKAGSDFGNTSNVDILLDTYTLQNNEKKAIEKQINDVKNNNSDCKYEAVILINKLKLLPDQLQTNIANEINIYNEELTNIDITTQDAIQTYIKNIEDTKEKKNILFDNINILEQQINQQNNVISDLQITAHTSRKNIISTLHYKKQKKQQLQTQINTIQESNNLYNEQLDILNNTNAFLIQAKINIINNYYSNDTSTSTSTSTYNSNILLIIQSLQDYDIQIDIPTYSNIDSNTMDLINIPNISSIITSIINKIDNLLNDNTARINNIIQKAQKTKLKTAYHIEILKNESDATSIDADSIAPELSCTINYKDAYKIEKAKRIELQNQYNELQKQYNNYDELVINKMQNEHNINIIELQNYKSSAKQRLDIIQERLNNNFTKDKTNLEDNIKLIQSKLYNNNNIITNLNTQINNINLNLSTLDANKTELCILDNKINQITAIIITLQNDIKYLENN